MTFWGGFRSVVKTLSPCAMSSLNCLSICSVFFTSYPQRVATFLILLFFYKISNN